MSKKDVESTLLRKIVEHNPIGSDQVQLIGLGVVKAVQLKLAHAQPFEVECESAFFRFVDATNLNVVIGNAGSLVSAGVEDYGDFAGKFLGPIQQCWKRDPRNPSAPEALYRNSLSSKT